MKKQYLKAFVALVGIAITAIFSGCNVNCIKGSGTEKSEDRKVADFTKLDIAGGYKVVLKQDSSLNVHITADDNLLEHIQTEITGDELKIYTKPSICSSGQITLIIGVKNLEELHNAGAIDLSSDGKLNTKDLKIELAGASKVDLDLNADRLMTRGSGSSEIKLKGQAANHDIRLTGGGSLDALDFVVSTYNIEGTGAIDCKVNVLKELNVHSTGAADIEYKGNPTINSSKTGASSIKKID